MNQFRRQPTVEEKAMAMLGYRKAWTACGPGSFLWMKLPPKTS